MGRSSAMPTSTATRKATPKGRPIIRKAIASKIGLKNPRTWIPSVSRKNATTNALSGTKMMYSTCRCKRSGKSGTENKLVKTVEAGDTGSLPAIITSGRRNKASISHLGFSAGLTSKSLVIIILSYFLVAYSFKKRIYPAGRGLSLCRRGADQRLPEQSHPATNAALALTRSDNFVPAWFLFLGTSVQVFLEVFRWL